MSALAESIAQEKKEYEVEKMQVALKQKIREEKLSKKKLALAKQNASKVAKLAETRERDLQILRKVKQEQRTVDKLLSDSLDEERDRQNRIKFESLKKSFEKERISQQINQ